MISTISDWSAGAHWTGELAGAPGFRFHDAPDGDADAFGDPIDPAQDADFKAALRPVVDVVTKLLRAMAQAAPASPTAPVPEPTHAPTPISAARDDRPALFIADVPDSLGKLRKRAVATLAPQARILPSIPPPGTSAEHDRALAELMRGTDLSIHLLGEQPGRELDDSDETFPRRRCDLVRAADHPALIWLPDTLDSARVDDPDHRAWLQGIEDAPRGADGCRIARGSRERLLADLAELVAELAERRAGSGGSGIVIDPHIADQTYGFKLPLALKEHAPHLPLALTRDGDEPAERWSDFEQLVQRARDLIVLFGQVQPAWVRRRVERAAKLAAAAERPALERIWVLLLPEHREPLSLPRLGGAPRLALLYNSATPDIAPANVERLLQAAGARS